MDKKSIQEDSGSVKYTELQNHVEYKASDLDSRGDDELSVAHIIIGWVLVIGFIVGCGIALFGEWFRSLSW